MIRPMQEEMEKRMVGTFCFLPVAEVSLVFVGDCRQRKAVGGAYDLLHSSQAR
jgi:hypothetical protein